MTATDRLRALLDERGVEWWSMHDVENGYHQDRDTEFVIDGKKYTAHEWGNTMNVYGLIPEQAVEATLGRGTCSISGGECDQCGAYIHEDAVLFWVPAGGGLRTVESRDVSYCPNCGRRVVK